jgi:hypothetical protein
MERYKITDVSCVWNASDAERVGCEGDHSSQLLLQWTTLVGNRSLRKLRDYEKMDARNKKKYTLDSYHKCWPRGELLIVIGCSPQG